MYFIVSNGVYNMQFKSTFCYFIILIDNLKFSKLSTRDHITLKKVPNQMYPMFIFHYLYFLK